MESGRKPFVFGVTNIYGEPELGTLLHKQFACDNDLVKEAKRMGFQVNFTLSHTVVDAQSGAVVETVGVGKNGQVGSLDLIDEKEIPKVQSYIGNVNQLRRKGQSTKTDPIKMPNFS